MSTHVREQAERLRQKYARAFQVDLDKVTVREFVNRHDQEDAEVFAPGHGMPVWTVGS